MTIRNSEICHSGIKGQKWGIRRFQREDMTWTEAGKKRYGDQSAGRKAVRLAKKTVDVVRNAAKKVGDAADKISQTSSKVSKTARRVEKTVTPSKTKKQMVQKKAKIAAVGALALVGGVAIGVAAHKLNKEREHAIDDLIRAQSQVMAIKGQDAMTAEEIQEARKGARIYGLRTIKAMTEMYGKEGVSILRNR